MLEALKQQVLRVLHGRRRDVGRVTRPLQHCAPPRGALGVTAVAAAQAAEAPLARHGWALAIRAQHNIKHSLLSAHDLYILLC